MNIGFDAKRAFYNHRGLGSYSRVLIKALRKYYPENNYHLYSPSAKRPSPYLKDFESKSFKIDHKRRLSGAFWRSALMSSQFERDGLEIYHGLSNEIPLKPSGCKTRLVVTIHDLAFLNFPQHYPFIDRKIYQFKTRHAVRNADAVVAVSGQTADDICRHFNLGPDEMTVLAPSCDEVFFEVASPSFSDEIRRLFNLPEKYFLYVGALTGSKNVMKILEAIDLLKNRQYRLVIVGDGPAKKLLTRFCQDRNISQQVIFIKEPEQIIPEQLAEIYRLATATILISHHEGFGLPLLESLAAGTPFIASIDHPVSESIASGGLLIDPNEPGSLADTMKQLHLDHSLASGLALEGKNEARSYHPKLMAQRLFEFYRKVLQ